MACDSGPTLFNLPPGIAFLEAMAETLVEDPTLGGALSDVPVSLSDLTILLPTRRAVRNLADAFLRAGGGAATLLPTIRPLGDVDEDMLLLGGGVDVTSGITLPPAIESMDRQLRLARLVLAWGEGSEFGPRDPGQAAALAAELAHLIDAAETEGVDLSRVREIVPDRFAAHWQQTLVFLDIALTYWPQELEECGLLDPAKRRNLLIRSQADAWAVQPPAHPVLAAGSTGSVPATAELLSTIARLPNGAVVLPGLDQQMEARGWEAVGASHPQFGMKQLLRALNVERSGVQPWPMTEARPASPRAALLGEVMRPAETTDRWAELTGASLHLDAAMEGLTLIEAPTPRQEAGALALAMREALEVPERTAMLVTPDRNLARRVAEELSRWDIAIDDTAGVPLAQSVPFTFLRLLTEAVLEDLAPVPLLALLKHPLSALGLDPAECRLRARRLERYLLRGPRPAPGTDGLMRALKSADLDGEAQAPLEDLIVRLGQALAPLADLFGEDQSLATLADGHFRAAEALAASDGEVGAARLWRGDAGEAAAQFADGLLRGADALPQMDPAAYLRLLETLAEGAVVRPRFGQHPRLFILGPLEARLIDADLVLLAGLNEETWPAEAPIDAWLSRPMRADLGLEPPERRIGLSAHDFAQAACAREVILSRSLKVDGAPTVPSRWLLRLDSLLKGLRDGEGLRPRETWSGWADRMDAPDTLDPVVPPAPRPPLEARPRQFSATEVETLIRDPYAIYAKKVLRLRALDPIDADVSAIERGNIIHAALEAFVKKHPCDLPDEAEKVLRAIGEDVFAEAPDGPGVSAFWWPRFCDIADWIAGFEARIRPETKYAHAEIRGEWELTDLVRPVKLTAIADRVDERDDGTFAIYDYKTGSPPSKREVEAGLAPQLPLEAAIAKAGGFAASDGKTLKGRPVSTLSYLHLSGGTPGGAERVIAPIGDGLAEETLAAFEELLRLYEQEATPYLSRPRVQFQKYAGRYDHLARVKEWSAALDDEAAS